MIKFNYTIGASIVLNCQARYIPPDKETGACWGVEVTSVKCNGLEVETGDIEIGGAHLDELLEYAGRCKLTTDLTYDLGAINTWVPT